MPEPPSWQRSCSGDPSWRWQPLRSRSCSRSACGSPATPRSASTSSSPRTGRSSRAGFRRSSRSGPSPESIGSSCWSTSRKAWGWQTATTRPPSVFVAGRSGRCPSTSAASIGGSTTSARSRSGLATFYGSWSGRSDSGSGAPSRPTRKSSSWTVSWRRSRPRHGPGATSPARRATGSSMRTSAHMFPEIVSAPSTGVRPRAETRSS